MTNFGHHFQLLETNPKILHVYTYLGVFFSRELHQDYIKEDHASLHRVVAILGQNRNGFGSNNYG